MKNCHSGRFFLFYLLIISASFYLFYIPLTLLLCGAVQFNVTSFSSAFLWFSILLYFSTLFTFVGVGVSLFYAYSFTLKIGVSVISFFLVHTQCPALSRT